MGRFGVVLDIARDLTASLAAADRYDRLLRAVRRLIPCDAAALLRLEGDELVPLAAYGLSEEAKVRRYRRKEHPRLDIILSAAGPVRFPPDSPLPDPFDGLLEADPHATEHIHACLGCPLVEGGRVVGALTADAVAPRAFDDLELPWLEALGALAAAALHTTGLIESLERIAERKGAVARELQRRSSDAPVPGRSPASERLQRDIEMVAASDLPVLIVGETGVGKEVVAHQIHQRSSRSEEPVIHVNCAALPESIAESELFGHAKGAFTGATRDRAGKFELADGATLFLDEIGELPLTLQPKLLRALQQGEIQRVGDDRVHRVDARIIAATNRDLDREVTAGRFRADLYHRLAVYPLRVPPLRERTEDIPLLAAHCLDQARRRLGVGPLRLSPEARQMLVAADWPGNVRELENVLNRAALRARAGFGERETIVLRPEHLDLPLASSGRASDEPGDETRVDPAAPLRERVREFQRQAIRAALARNSDSWAAAARDLGMHRSNLHHLAARLGLRE
ncbi:MAG: nitric oxide reductase transcriptional regulator NorR [Gemmatimonadetes bacterium]|nr:nitric oxide reductase transcriptional regulator NorR [Gemmatimonadota bacterium]